jgi:hypothetical protein
MKLAALAKCGIKYGKTLEGLSGGNKERGASLDEPPERASSVWSTTGFEPVFKDDYDFALYFHKLRWFHLSQKRVRLKHASQNYLDLIPFNTRMPGGIRIRSETFWDG